MGARLEQEWAKTMKHIKAICEILESADEYRALVALRALVSRKEELENYIQQVVDLSGADNIGNAITKIKASAYGRPGLFELPEQLQRIPKLWLEGRAETRKVKGVLKMTFFHAERQHRRLTPYLQDVWKVASTYDIETEEALKEKILQSYEESSADDMLRFCYAFLSDYDLEEDGEEQECETIDPTLAELQQILNRKIDYGVESKSEVQ